MTRESSFEEAIESAFVYKMRDFYFALPCIILTVHNQGKTQKVDVQPCINDLRKDGTNKELPPIYNVPVSFQSSRTTAFTFPINKGDKGTCLFMQRSLDVFKDGTGQPSPPNDYRRFDIKDAVFYPGLFPFNDAPNNPSKHTLPHDTKDAVIVHNLGTGSECEVRLKSNGDIKATSPTKFEVVAPITNVTSSISTTVTSPVVAINASTSFTVTSPIINLIGNTTLQGNFTMISGSYTATFNGNVATIGTITNNGKNIGDTHTHGGVDTGSGHTNSVD